MISLGNAIHGVVDFTWPMVLISAVVIVSLRIVYLIKNKQKLVLYKEIFMLAFIIYILCLFQIVTFQDVVSWSKNNFIPFREITRYKLGSRLFFKNVLGNMIMFLPYGFFSSVILKLKKPNIILFLTLIASVSIECVQLSIGRVFDVDDIMLNVLGGVLGFYLYYFLEKLANTIPSIFKSEWFLNIVCILLLIGCLTLI